MDDKIEAECAEHRRAEQVINSKLDLILEKLGSSKNMDDQAHDTSRLIHSSSPASIQTNDRANGGQRIDGLASQPNLSLAENSKCARSGRGGVELESHGNSLQDHGAALPQQFHSRGPPQRARIHNSTIDKVEGFVAVLRGGVIAHGNDSNNLELSVGDMILDMIPNALHSQIPSTRLGST